jgi:hypothetical protein
MRASLVVLCLAPALAAAEPTAKTWSGTVGAGLIHLAGNTNTTTVSGTTSIQEQLDPWVLGFKATGAYGEARPVDRTQRSQTVALSASGQLRLDRKLGPHATVFALGGTDTDHVASVEARVYGEGGLAWIWVDVKPDGAKAELFFRTDAGVRYANERRWQYHATPAAPVGNLPDVETTSPRVGLALRYGFSKDVAFVEEAEALANVSGAERYQARSLTKLTSRLWASVTFGVSYLLTWDSEPAPGKVETDRSLAATLEVAF